MLLPLDELPRSTFRASEEQITIFKAPQRVKLGVSGIPLLLHLFGLTELRLCLARKARLVQGVSVGCTLAHPLKRIAAAISVDD